MRTTIKAECVTCRAPIVHRDAGGWAHVHNGAQWCPDRGPDRTLVDPVSACGDCGSEDLTTRWLESGDETTCRACGASEFRSIGF